MDQERIWEHFQTTRVDSFDHARGRYAAVVKEVVGRIDRAPARVLNIGIGAGVVERTLLARGWQIAALDPSPEAVAPLARDGIDARCGYAQDIPFETASFDAVIASEVLEHIEAGVRRRVLAEIHRVLDDQGWFVGSVPYRENLADGEVVCPDCGKIFHRWGHVDSFDLPRVTAELGAQFDAVTCRRLSFVDWAGARGPVKLLKAGAQALLGRLGEPIASPSILFAARKRDGRSRTEGR